MKKDFKNDSRPHFTVILDTKQVSNTIYFFFIIPSRKIEECDIFGLRALPSVANGQEETLKVSTAFVPQGILQRHVILLQVHLLDGLQIKLQTVKFKQTNKQKKGFYFHLYQTLILVNFSALHCKQ